MSVLRLGVGGSASLPWTLAAKNVEMEVVDFLAALGARVGQQTETAVRARVATVSKSNFRCKNHYSTQPAGIFLGYVLKGDDMMSGHDKQMDGCSRMDIMKNNAIMILVDNLGRDFTLDDFAENAVFTHNLRSRCSGYAEKVC